MNYKCTDGRRAHPRARAHEGRESEGSSQSWPPALVEDEGRDGRPRMREGP